MNTTSEATNSAGETSAPAKKRAPAASGKTKARSRAKSSGKRASSKAGKAAKAKGKGRAANGTAAASTSRRQLYHGLNLLPDSYKAKLWEKLMGSKNKFIPQSAAILATYGRDESANFGHCRQVILGLRNLIAEAKLPLEIRVEEKQVGVFAKGR